MALANVGLLSAFNGKRVLLMDWDLEAPGLGYYFRGLLNRRDEIALRESPGILNILSDWSDSVRPSSNDADLTKIRQRYHEGTPFSNSVRSLVEPGIAAEIFPDTACLHFIGAGSRKIGQNEAPYEQALAEFSWTNFFSEHVGGFLLESLRAWAKENYDLVLIDSRTGLADAAGICTMQMPDEVALCFALNHQNIEGTARVAASINSLAHKEIKVRAVPMRVARRDSSESSDAQARAISALINTAKLNSDMVKFDLQNLAIAFEDSVPFYETLAPFAANDPALDPLCLSYLRLTKSLIGTDVLLKPINAGVTRRVRERLSPRNATTQYLYELQSAEPARTFSELHRLTEIAQDTALENGSLDVEYIFALFDGAVDLLSKLEEVDEAFELLKGVREVVRLLADRNDSEWGQVYLSLLQRSLLEISVYGRDQDEFEIRREIEAGLSDSTETEDLVRRLSNLTELARLHVRVGEMQTVPPVLECIKTVLDVLVPRQLTSAQKWQLFLALINATLVGSEAAELTGNIDEARRILEKGLTDIRNMRAQFGDGGQDEFDKLEFNLHFRLAILPGMPAEVGARHCVAAAELATQEFPFRYIQLAKIVLSADGDRRVVAEFCDKAFTSHRRRRLVPYFVRNPNRAIEFLQTLRDFLKELSESGNIEQPTTQLLTQTFIETLQTALKQKYIIAGSAHRIARLAEEFVARLNRIGFNDEPALIVLEEALNLIKNKANRDN